MTLGDHFLENGIERFSDFHESPMGIFGIFNYDSLTYDYISPNVRGILGYDMKLYLEGGLNFHLSTLSDTHSDILATQVFPVYLEHCAKHSIPNDIKALRFVYEYQVNTSFGKSLWCLHQSMIIDVDENGYPKREMFFITDISMIKHDFVINFSISTKSDKGYFEAIYTKAFSTRSVSVLSSRELEILKLLCGGNSTPKIASLLYLSEHTVKSHRKNIMQKLEVKNSIDILKVALEKGLL